MFVCFLDNKMYDGFDPTLYLSSRIAVYITNIKLFSFHLLYYYPSISIHHRLPQYRKGIKGRPINKGKSLVKTHKNNHF